MWRRIEWSLQCRDLIAQAKEVELLRRESEISLKLQDIRVAEAKRAFGNAVLVRATAHMRGDNDISN